MSSLQPFTIDIPLADVDDLQRRLEAVRWPQIAFDAGWAAGTNDAVLRDLVDHWRRDFDWFAWQEHANTYEHLRGPLEGELTHCVRFRATGGQSRIPILIMHGWPGSFVEHLDAAQRLASGAEGPAFDVIVPSLPGYAFSEPPKQPGMHLGRIAERMHLLMRDLGYERYGVQGGDWGAAVGSRLAQQHPEAVIGLHLNFAIAPPPPLEELSDDERAALRDAEMWRMQETAYAMLQGTKPQTLAYALVDSPTGLLAWILEKFWAWSDHGDDLWQTFEKDAVLANVSLYWFTNTVLSAARTYYEARRESPAMAVTAGRRVEVPTAFANFPAEPFRSPRAAIERAYNLVRWTDQQKGGHFAAMEQPELFAKDVAEFFASL